MTISKNNEVTMPIYEYQCHDCGHILEALQKISDEPLKQCPELKGTGWYATDFKTKPQTAPGTETKPAATETTPPAAATKPATTDGTSTKE
jgi:predicted nucleic acid-binding Zn ribbon protein